MPMSESQGSARMRVLLLGGTAEAAALAGLLAKVGIDAVYSLAGRTAAPTPVALPTRTGGFGGAVALAAFLQGDGYTHLIDATHPFAARMHRNAVEAAARARIPHLALVRAPWRAGDGDRWTRVADHAAARDALPAAPATVFLAIGRQDLADFADLAVPHRLILRVVDPPDRVLIAGARVLVARGPFDAAAETALLRREAIDLIVTKNSGGTGARGKLDAARELGLPVIMIDRPARLAGPSVDTAEAARDWLHATPSARRGV
jgi:precorrin-6A/cobalt-precorrin-6A reductase